MRTARGNAFAYTAKKNITVQNVVVAVCVTTVKLVLRVKNVAVVASAVTTSAKQNVKNAAEGVYVLMTR